MKNMPPMDSYKIVLADDNVLFRQSLKRILTEKGGIEVIGEAGDGLGLISLVNKLTPHLSIVDCTSSAIVGQV